MNTSIKNPDDIFKQIEDSFYLYFRMITQSSYFVEEGLSLTVTELHMLKRIEKLGIATVTKLAADVGITKGGISTLVSKLEIKQLVVKEPDEKHGSRVLITATARGKKILEKFEEIHTEHNRHLMAFLHNLSPEELRTINAFSNEMHQWITLYNYEQKDTSIDNK